MPVFRCEAMGSGGDVKRDQVEAANADEATRLFRAKGLFVTKVVEVTNSTDEATSSDASDSEPQMTESDGSDKEQSLAVEPPRGSGVQCRLNGEQLILYIPPSSAIYQGPFPFIAISFVGLLTLITLFAVFGGVEAGEARFVVPILCFLWLFGLGLLYIYVRGRFGKTYVLVEPGRLVRRFDLFGRQRMREYSLDRNSWASLVADFSFDYGGGPSGGSILWGWSSGGGKPVKHIHVTTADRPVKFGSYLSPEEKDWLVARINRHLGH